MEENSNIVQRKETSKALPHHITSLQLLRIELKKLSEVANADIEAAQKGQGHKYSENPELLKRFMFLVQDKGADDNDALATLVANGFEIDPVPMEGAAFIGPLAAREFLALSGSPGQAGARLNVGSRTDTRRTLSSNLINPSPKEPSTFYANQHKDTNLILLNSLENFPPLPPIHPVRNELLQEMINEYEKPKRRVGDTEAQQLLKEFRTTQPILLSMKLEWTFGINRHIPFVNLSTDNQKTFFYCAGHTGVVYSYEHDGSPIEPVQILLEGLDQQITCIATTKNGRWLAAGDTGPDYAAIVWDLQQDAVPMRIYSTPNGKDAYGLASICFSPNMRFLAMLSTGDRQVLSLYEWLVDSKSGSEKDTPVVFYYLPQGETLQGQLSFNPMNQDMLMSCSKDRIVLYQWHAMRTKGQVRTCVPNTTKVPSFNPIGNITRCAFVPATTHFVVGTEKGLVALFRKRVTHKNVLPFEEYCEAAKVYRAVENGSVSALTCLNGMIVIGDSLGNVKFYDSNLLILYTCKDINLGGIDTISFAKLKVHKELTTKFDNKAFFVSEFMVGSSSGCIGDIRTTGDDQFVSKLVREEPRDAVLSCAVHPSTHRFVLGSSCGLLRMWNYKNKTIIVQRRFDRAGCGDQQFKDVTAVAFDPTGVYIGCGFASGEFRIVKSADLSDEPNGSFSVSLDRILFVEFSYNGLHLATADDQGIVGLYHNNTGQWSPTWIFVGCHQSHNGTALTLQFVKEYDGEKERLFSLGLDSCLVEYDLDNSANGDLLISYRELIDQEAQTFSFAYYPPISKESFLITANDKYKLKLWNVSTKMCRKTINGPLQGSPVMGMMSLPSREGDSNRYILWRNADSVGLMALPLDGNPYRYCSRRVHPLGVSCMKTSANGRFVFTAGGAEACVHMWSVHPEVLESSLEGKKDSLIPFFDLFEGGMDGKLYKDLEEYFCYLQLKAQGFETRDTRLLQDVLPLQELPNLFCALSFYPSERERKDIINEIKYSRYAENGLIVTNVDVSTALKVFVNHRPIWGIQYPELIKAFAMFGFEELRTTVKSAQLVQILEGVGESMTMDEATCILGILMNLRPPLGDWETVGAERDYYNSKMTLPKDLTVKQIIEDVLAFQTTPAFHMTREKSSYSSREKQ